MSRYPNLDDATVPLRPACAIEDAVQILTVAGAPMAATGLIGRLLSRWTRPAAVSAVQALLASRRIEWATVGGRAGCLQFAGWKPEDAPQIKRVRVPIKPLPKQTRTNLAKYMPSNARKKQLQELLREPHSIKECADKLGLGWSRTKKYMGELRDAGDAVVIGEVAHEGRGRGTRIYVNPNRRKAA